MVPQVNGIHEWSPKEMEGDPELVTPWVLRRVVQDSCNVSQEEASFMHRISGFIFFLFFSAAASLFDRFFFFNSGSGSQGG
jgi:hypothetical protein